MYENGCFAYLESSSLKVQKDFVTASEKHMFTTSYMISCSIMRTFHNNDNDIINKYLCYGVHYLTTNINPPSCYSLTRIILQYYINKQL